MDFDSKKIFLIDAAGATASSFFLGVILPSFETFFGMPKTVLYILASIACLFAIYSFTCFFQIPENWQFFLRLIVIANIVYCCLSLGLVLYFFDRLTILGILFFISEVILILGIVHLEFSVLKRELKS